MNESVVEVIELEKRFGQFVAVDRISFSVHQGEIFGLLGANGSGKSTTIRMLCGILEPSYGYGTVVGFDLRREPEKIKSAIGYMSQKFSLYEDLTILENIRLYLGIYQVPRARWSEKVEWFFETFGLRESQGRKTGDLPPGWKQRLALGCAILHEPQLLILDEPTSGVDLVTRRSFWSFIKELAEKGTSVMVTTHYMDEATNCHRLILLNEGKIIASGTPREIVENTLGLDSKGGLQEAFIRLVSRKVQNK